MIAACAGELHAADCCRLLWAYSTADVVDTRMLAAVTGATAPEMYGVLPRTAAGAVWSLAQMRFEAPFFMEEALDRLAVCLEATPVALPGKGVCGGNGRQGAVAKGATAAASSTATKYSSSSGTADRPSVLQQLLQGPAAAALLSGGPEASSTPAGELSMLAMMHRRRRIHGSSSSKQQQQWDGQEQDNKQQQQRSQQLYESGNGNSSSSTFPPDGDDTLQEEQQRWQQLSELDEQQQQRQRMPYLPSEVVHCSHRDVAQAVYACGRLKHYNGAFFRVLRGKLPGLLPGFSDVQLVEVLWGLAQLNLCDAANMEAAAAEVRKWH